MNLVKFVDNNIVCFMSAAAAIAMSNRFTATHKEQEKNKHLIYSPRLILVAAVVTWGQYDCWTVCCTRSAEQL